MGIISSVRKCVDSFFVIFITLLTKIAFVRLTGMYAEVKLGWGGGILPLTPALPPPYPDEII